MYMNNFISKVGTHTKHFYQKKISYFGVIKNETKYVKIVCEFIRESNEHCKC